MNADKTLTPALSAQLRALAIEFVEARQRAHRVAAGLPAEIWTLRPEPERWSIAEQILHLNLASHAYLPVIEDAIARGRDSGTFGDGPYRRDFLGWMLARLVEPPVRLRVKTRDAFVPVQLAPPAEALSDFDHWQDRFAAVLQSAAGLALDRIEVASPYDPCLRLNLYSFLRTIPAHQRHHLWIAERIRTGLEPQLESKSLEVAR
jgi:hypothetical protein